MQLVMQRCEWTTNNLFGCAASTQPRLSVSAAIWRPLRTTRVAAAAVAASFYFLLTCCELWISEPGELFVVGDWCLVFDLLTVLSTITYERKVGNYNNPRVLWGNY